MWQAGYAVTDPGYSFYHPEIQMMDPGPEDRLGIMMKLARALDANRCDERCRVSAPLPPFLPWVAQLPCLAIMLCVNVRRMAARSAVSLPSTLKSGIGWTSLLHS